MARMMAKKEKYIWTDLKDAPISFAIHIRDFLPGHMRSKFSFVITEIRKKNKD